MELGFVFAVVGVAEHVAVVALAIHVLVLRDEVDVVDSDVNLETGLAVPQEVGRLSEVRHVVGRFEVTRVVKVLGDDIR